MLVRTSTHYATSAATNEAMLARTSTHYVTSTTSEAMLRKALRSGLIFLPWSGGALWSVKNKKLFERSEFFLFSGINHRSRKKNAAGEFSLLRFFCSSKRNEEPCGLSKKKQIKFSFVNFSFARKQKKSKIMQYCPKNPLILQTNCKNLKELWVTRKRESGNTFPTAFHVW